MALQTLGGIAERGLRGCGPRRSRYLIVVGASLRTPAKTSESPIIVEIVHCPRSADSDESKLAEHVVVCAQEGVRLHALS